MIHGTNERVVQGVHRASEVVVHGIVTSGFGTVAVVDQGYYGQGGNLTIFLFLFFLQITLKIHVCRHVFYAGY